VTATVSCVSGRAPGGGCEPSAGAGPWVRGFGQSKSAASYVDYLRSARCGLSSVVYLPIHEWRAPKEVELRKPTNPRPGSPVTVKDELWVYLLAYNVVRLLMAQAAVEHEVLPRNSVSIMRHSCGHTGREPTGRPHGLFCRH
jgi:hypothetical protein